MPVIRSLLFNTFLLMWGVIITVGPLLVLALSESKIRKVTQWWAKGSLWGLRHIVGVRLSITGLEHIPEGPVIVASKHQSALETILFVALLPRPVYILKRELLNIPLYGLYLRRLNMIAVRARDANLTESLIAKVGATLSAPRQLIIFPEGTRSQPGAKPKYRKGIVRIHQAFPDVPVVPVALTTGVVWPRRSFMKHPGICHVAFLPPLITSSHETFFHDLQTTIEDATTHLLQLPCT